MVSHSDQKKTNPTPQESGSKENLPAVKEVVKDHEQNSMHQFVLDTLMDTPEDKAKFKIVRSLDGKVYNNGSNIMYSVVFAVKRGIYSPVVVFDNGDVTIVANRVAELVAQILAYEVDETKPKPLYPNVKSIPDYEKYQFFKYKGVTYKFSMPVFWNDNLQINSVSDGVINDIIDGRVYTKKIYDDVVKEITDYYFHTSKDEFDVLASFSFMTYIYQVMGKVLYIAFFGGQGTGKTWGIEILAHLMRNGYSVGKGTIPSTVRKIEYQQISLAQDEFEKMGKDERITFIAVMNAGFNPHKTYDITNMAVKDLTKQSVGFRTFCPKAFTCNSLYGLDLSFLDRLYIVHSVKADRTVKDIMDPSESDIARFQKLRDMMFIYVLKNWKNIVRDINTVKRELHKDGAFGRKADIYSMILGIIRHFKGKEYSDGIRKYMDSKAEVELRERAESYEAIILTKLVEIYEEDKADTIDIANKHLHLYLCQKKGFDDPDDKRAPSNQTPRKILDYLGLIAKKENKGYTPGGARMFHIHLEDIVFVLKRDKHDDLLKRILFVTQGTTQTIQTSQTTQLKTERTEGSYRTESRSTLQKAIDLSKYENTIKKATRHIKGEDWYSINDIAKDIGNDNPEWLDGILKQAILLNDYNFLETDGKGNYKLKSDFGI